MQILYLTKKNLKLSSVTGFCIIMGNEIKVNNQNPILFLFKENFLEIVIYLKKFDSVKIQFDK